MSEKNQSNQQEKKKVRFSVGRTVEKINNIYEDNLEKNDPALTQPIHKEVAAPKDQLMIRGGVDIYFLLIVIVISLFGIIMAYSASAYDAEHYMHDSLYYLKRHIAFLLISTTITIPFVMYGRPWVWKAFGIAVYALSIILLIVVLFVGREGNGAQRWIQIGPLTIQPSEIAKMSTVIFLSLIMSKHQDKLKVSQRFGGSFKYGVLYPGLAIAAVCGLVMLEKHLSGLIIIGLLGLTIMFIGGTEKKWMLLIIGAGILAVGVILLFSGYAQERVKTWIDLKNADPTGPAWQTWQGLYAIGSGGIFGVGLGNSRQKYGYVSEPQNDFIFTIVCEELGFIGAVALIGLFILLLWRGYVIASRAPDKFSSLVVYGLTTKVALQAALNIAVVTNSMPNTGIALPFFSSGGTALMLQIFEMGIILNISRFSKVKK